MNSCLRLNDELAAHVSPGDLGQRAARVVQGEGGDVGAAKAAGGHEPGQPVELLGRRHGADVEAGDATGSESLDIRDIHFKVLRADSRRLHLVEVSKAAPLPQSADADAEGGV